MLFQKFESFVRQEQTKLSEYMTISDSEYSDSHMQLGELDLHHDELISVIVPAYNAEKWITETLSSIAAQVYPFIEVLVINDGSTDRTAEIVRQFTLSDDRFRLVEKVNGGVASARNLGIELAKGRLIAPCDADDLWSSKKLELQVRAWKKAGPNVGVVYCRSASIDANGLIFERQNGPFFRGWVMADMCRANLIGNGSSTLMRRDAVIAAGGYDESLRRRNAQGCEDFKLYLHLSINYNFDYADEYCVGYRHTQGNMSSDLWQMIRSQELVIDEFVQRFPALKQELSWNHAWFLNWLRRKALASRRNKEAFRILLEMFLKSPSITTRILCKSDFVFFARKLMRIVKGRPRELIKEASPEFFPNQHFLALDPLLETSRLVLEVSHTGPEVSDGKVV